MKEKRRGHVCDPVTGGNIRKVKGLQEIILGRLKSYRYTVFFNNYLFLSFIILLKYWDRTQRYQTKSHIISLSSLLCLAVASDCLTTLHPFWGNVEKEIFYISMSLPKKTRRKSPDTPCSFSWVLWNPFNPHPDRWVVRSLIYIVRHHSNVAQVWEQ